MGWGYLPDAIGTPEGCYRGEVLLWPYRDPRELLWGEGVPLAL